MASATRGSHACAVCKHQRRKCPPNCEMARYFPLERSQQFLDVHRLFGLSNLMKLYHAVSPEHRETTINSIVTESQIRRVDPVHGCLGLINDLNAQIDAALQELDAVRERVEFQQWMEQQQQQQPQTGGWLVPSLPQPPSPTLDPGYSDNDVGTSSDPSAHLYTMKYVFKRGRGH